MTAPDRIDIEFRDAVALAAQVDRWSSPGVRLLVGQDLIDRFAGLSGDHNWIHVDVDRCRRESPFGGTVAHGNLLLALIPRVLPAEPFRIVGYRQAVNRGYDRIRFLKPVPAGTSIFCCSRLRAVDTGVKGTDITKEYCLFRAGEDEPALMAQVVLRYA